ncbi:MAG: 6-carboxytetrahydropterin synthase, partial [Schwartzia sp.]|nr:6-carboxytetrahydropterin synthase [Schwartzia sp. (in: firmicutes)]
MFELEVKCTFDAAHRVEGYPGKCDRLHGHTWTIAAKV